MSAIKNQIFRLNTGQSGADNCDFRGDRAPLLTKENGDYHRTITGLEVDPAPEAYIEAVKQYGPQLNAATLAIETAAGQAGVETIAGKLATVLGLEGDGPVGTRIVIMDK